MNRVRNSTRRRFLIQTGGLAALAPLCSGQDEAALMRRAWSARWIAPPGAAPAGYGVYYFRRTFELSNKPDKFGIHVTADNRYQLFVNGRRAAWGPARGDLFHWRYETVDIAPLLAPGKNVLAAVAWNFGPLAPEAQVTLQTGFLLQGDAETQRLVDTGANWKSFRDEAYTPLAFTSAQMRGYFVTGPGDRVSGAAHPWGWQMPEFDDSAWPAAAPVAGAAGREASDANSRWMLVERTIPAMEERPERLQRLRSVTGIPQPAGFPAQAKPFQVPAGAKATLLLDQSYLTTAYPELTVSGGKDAVVRMRYAEALIQPATAPARGFDKGNRDEVEGKQFLGYNDEFVLDGGARRTFRPLWWRTYRYLQLEVETRGEPVTIEDLSATAVGYPFERKARFEAGDPEIQKILDVGWRTARLCAHETYMDCPYYEQLQYVGDTRVQCLISLFNSGDARLMRNAIDLINDSRLSEGCTMSRYPTRMEQYIPGFALWWIGMTHDYWRYVNDPAFVRRMLPGVRSVLSFFEGYQNQDGSLKPLPWWRYFDWVPGWPSGNAPQDADGPSALFDMLLLLGYRWAAEMETALGLSSMGAVYRERERQLRATTQKLYWDEGRKLYADTPRKASFSQHANILAVLGDVATGQAARDLALRILTEPGLAQAQIFFRFYLHCALTKVGEGDRYLDQLGEWRDMLARGLTTFAETADRPGAPSRSDCHAWSASPNIEVFRTVLGVDSAAPAFARVSVRPHLGKLKSVSGAVPHPAGMIEVKLEPQGAGYAVSVSLPPGIPGEFEWRGTRHSLAPGINRFTA